MEESIKIYELFMFVFLQTNQQNETVTRKLRRLAQSGHIRGGHCTTGGASLGVYCRQLPQPMETRSRPGH